MSNDSNIKKELEIVQSVYKQTQTVIDGMPVEGANKRMQIKDMAEVVGVAVGMEPKDVLHMVNRYAHNAIGGYVSRGKNGGFIKGPKPLKVEKPSVIKAGDSSVAIPSDETESE